jgi:hypothetical protein
MPIISCLIAYLNSNAGAITGISTFLLALITFLYLYVTYQIRVDAEKSRVDAKKPILSFQSDDYPGTGGNSLYLCNYGPIARNVSIKTTCGTVLQSNHFLYTLGQYERVMVCGEWNTARRDSKKITTMVEFCDADLKQYTDEISIDYSQISRDVAIGIPVLRPVRADCYIMNSGKVR